MTDNRLNNLAILHTESDINIKMLYDEIIQEFSENKLMRT